MLQTLEYQVLDVFTTERYQGNPLAVVKLTDTNDITQEQKLAITSEFNLSETVFIYPKSQNRTEWGADIFTLGTELPWAGHPTIGSAYAIASESRALYSATLMTKAGPVDLKFTRDFGGSCATASALVPSNLHLHAATLDLAAVRVLQPCLKDVDLRYSSFAVMSIANGMNFALIELPSVEVLSKLSSSSNKTPKDFVKLDAGWNDTLIGAYFYVCVEEEGLKKAKLHCRMFLGLLEDPATGSAASALAAYLAVHCDVRAPPHCDYQWTYAIEQGRDMGRTSHIGVVVDRRDGLFGQTDPEQPEIRLSGSCASVMLGTLIL